MAFKSFYLDDVMSYHDPELYSEVQGYAFSNGKKFMHKHANHLCTEICEHPEVPKLPIFSGQKWQKNVGCWDDEGQWTDDIL